MERSYIDASGALVVKDQITVTGPLATSDDEEVFSGYGSDREAAQDADLLAHGRRQQVLPQPRPARIA